MTKSRSHEPFCFGVFYTQRKYPGDTPQLARTIINKWNYRRQKVRLVNLRNLPRTRDYNGLGLCSLFGRWWGQHAGLLGQNDALVPLRQHQLCWIWGCVTEEVQNKENMLCKLHPLASFYNQWECFKFTFKNATLYKPIFSFRSNSLINVKGGHMHPSFTFFIAEGERESTDGQQS